MKSDDPISEALSEVVDPEMGISVTELGLIYGIEREQGHVEVTMTLTSPGCPVAPEIMAAVHRATLSVEDVESAHVNLTFSPLWNPRIHATEDAQMELGVF
jgi:metal-sulfur cluster biosynthetic enzyme